MGPERDAYDVLQVSPRAGTRVLEAAYLALAAVYGPDGDGSDVSMQQANELEDAYAKLRTPELRAAYDQHRMRREVMEAASATPFHQAAAADPGAGDSRAAAIDFGRYAGWTIADLARHDPDYLRWLSRHSSGIRYRHQIEEALRQASGRTPRR